MTSSRAQFAEDLARFVKAEAEATRRSFLEQWGLPVSERVAAGRCVTHLQFVSEKKSRLHFRCAEFHENNSDLREGEPVRLSRGDPNLPMLAATLYRIEDRELWIEPAGRWEHLTAELESESFTLDPTYIDLEQFYQNALRELVETDRGRERILPLLCSEIAPKIDLARFDEAVKHAEDEGVNEAQSEAIAHAVATDLSHLVQGPPGTGKTFALAHIVRQRVARGERIAVTAVTHRAIHNALNTIRQVAPEIDAIVKIGREIYDPELTTPQFPTFAASPLSGSGEAYVVGATPFTLRSGRLRGVDFDTVVIDEAGQMTLPLAAMAMLCADRYILIGDHRQLPPIIQSGQWGAAPEDSSAFGALRERGFNTMLEITYRMNTELVKWPSESFYSGKLRSAEGTARRRLALPQPAREFAEILDPNEPIVFVKLAHEDARRVSDDEAALAANLLVTLAQTGFPLAQAAVVTPFRRQARRIRSLLAARAAISEQDRTDCVIDTVERLQGQQREVVILSMTASHPDYLAKIAGFLLQPQRLNVAVTRARSKVIILGSAQIAEIDLLDTERGELVELWRSLIAGAKVVNG